MTGTALLAGEALADSEVLAYVLKVSLKRVRPHTLSPGDNYWDTWFESPGSFLSSNGGCPPATALRPFRSRRSWRGVTAIISGFLM